MRNLLVLVAGVGLVAAALTACGRPRGDDDRSEPKARATDERAPVSREKATPPVAAQPVMAKPPADLVPSCLPCTTQEDFDAVMKKGSKCCPVNACQADAQCSGGRVCCKIPDGTLCADTKRCVGANRVNATQADLRDAHCRSICPGKPVELTNCYCSCMGQCPPN